MLIRIGHNNRQLMRIMLTSTTRRRLTLRGRRYQATVGIHGVTVLRWKK